MTKAGIEQAALAEKFALASAQQGEALRQAVQQFTMQALRSRELTARSIRNVLNAVTRATSSGVTRNGAVGEGIESLLVKAMEGMDGAMAQVIEANRRALQQLVVQGAKLHEPRIKKALAEIRSTEATLFQTVAKAASGEAQPIHESWSSALGAVTLKGSQTDASAAAAITQLTDDAGEALRNGRALQQRSVGLWMEHYATLLSGVFIGISNALNTYAGPAPSRHRRCSRT